MSHRVRWFPNRDSKMNYITSYKPLVALRNQSCDVVLYKITNFLRFDVRVMRVSDWLKIIQSRVRKMEHADVFFVSVTSYPTLYKQ